jgi:putative membrane protein
MLATDFWRWQPHPEVWLLLGSVIAGYGYALRVIGPKVVPRGRPIATRAQLLWFTAAIAVLWIAADWPVHDVAEEYLYSVHMGQHILLSLVLPPLVLLATPEWLARLLVGKGRIGRGFYRLAHPIPAAVIFNALALFLHWQVVVNASVDNGLLHYALHVAVVTAGLLFWIPVCGPLPELRLSFLAQMLYLFVASIVPTVPAAWLTFAEGAVYEAYDIPQRLWGLSVTTDQQIAGLMMKLLAGGYLWLIITIRFFQWAARHMEAERQGIDVSEREVLTWDDVRQEFEKHPAPSE